jgi:hypothetical protein
MDRDHASMKFQAGIHHQQSHEHEHHADGPGLSLLTQDEDELIAEDDLYWDSLPTNKGKKYTQQGGGGVGGSSINDDEKSEIAGAIDILESQGVFKGPKLEMELAKLGIQDDAEQIRTRLNELVKEKKAVSLKALVHFLYDGGELPPDFGAPSVDLTDTTTTNEGGGGGGGLVGHFGEDEAMKDMQARWDLMWKKAGGRGVLEELKGLGTDEEEMFDHDWKKENEEKLKLVVFSKVNKESPPPAPGEEGRKSWESKEIGTDSWLTSILTVLLSFLEKGKEND